jgi:DNA-binding CsgD family transcriptional regulator
MSHRFVAGPSTEDLLALVEQIHGCATEPQRLPQALHRLGALLHASVVQMLTLDVGTGAVLDAQFGEPALDAANRDYVNEWARFDPRLGFAKSLDRGSVFACHERFDEAFRAQDHFFQGFLNPQGLRWSLVGRFEPIAGVSMVLIAMRDAKHPAFDAAAVQLVKQLLPHFEAAAATGRVLERHTAAIESAAEALRMMPTPCLITDHVGRCMEGNEAFSRALEPLCVRIVTGRVRFDDPALQGRWESALFETHATALPKAVQFATPTGRAWKLRLLPWHALPGAVTSKGSRLILAIFDDHIASKAAEPPLGSMAAVARLTRAEAEVLTGLLKGLPAKVIAAHRNASVNTVRSQIMAILEKTGYNSQKELMASFGTSALPDSAFASSIFQSDP